MRLHTRQTASPARVVGREIRAARCRTLQKNQ